MSGTTLYLLRHAKAEQAGVAMTRAADHARPLAGRGRNDALALGTWMHARGIRPELALVSTAARTNETYELLHLEAPHLVTSEALYLADAEQLLAILRAQPEAGSILLVGHNPGLHELALQLAGGDPSLQSGLPTCTLVGFRISASWSKLGPDCADLSMIHRP